MSKDLEPLPEMLTIPVGDPARAWRIGDFLNSLDELVCWFRRDADVDEKELAKALRLYAERLDEGI